MAEDKEPTSAKKSSGDASNPYGPLVSAAQIPKLPATLNLYKSKIFTRSNFLGEHMDQPLLAVSRHSGLRGRPDMVLHCGTSQDDHLLAILRFPLRHPHSFVLELPSLKHDASTGGADGEEGKALQEKGDIIEFSHKFGFPHGVYTCSVPLDGDGRREPLEWKSIRDGQATELTGHHSCWVCLREPPGGTTTDAAASSGATKMKDGKEIVFAWADVPQSIHKEAVFRFFGSAPKKSAGDYWALAVLWCGLSMFEHYRRGAEAAAGASGGGGG